jgi:hypothetical protein
MSRLGAAALAAVFALSAPAAAIAQSAGDEQYRDPFAGQDQGSREAAPAPAPTPAPAPAPAPTTAAPTTVEPTATVAGTLPRTGAETAWVAATALLLVAAGGGLRRAART